MARYWSTYVAVTEKQASALDQMARANGYSDGIALLSEVSGASRSKIGKSDRLTVKSWVDECFQRFGR